MSAPTVTRPTGITILAVLAAIGGIIGLFGGFVVTFGGTVLFGGAGTLLGLALLAFSALSIAFAWGAWTMQPWAWPLGVVIAAGEIVLAIVWIIGGASIFSEIVNIVVYGAVLYYLNQPTIKSLFGRA
jgi:hypothetical protein